MHAGEEPKAVLVVVDGDVEAVVGRIVAPRCDLALVEALARLQLQARRDGHVIRLRDVSEPLCELLELVGLADLLTGLPGRSGPPGLSVEVAGQPEGREQLGVEEVADGGDLPA